MKVERLRVPVYRLPSTVYRLPSTRLSAFCLTPNVYRKIQPAAFAASRHAR
jgi:hypothetical protein